MSKVLLLSHGQLAKELFLTSRLVLGEIPGIEYLCLPPGIDLAQYEQDVREKVASAEDGLLILTDIFGGTPFITASRVYASLEDKSRLEVLTGMNLSMLLQVCSLVDTATVQELKRAAATAGLEGIIDLKDKV